MISERGAKIWPFTYVTCSKWSQRLWHHSGVHLIVFFGSLGNVDTKSHTFDLGKVGKFTKYSKINFHSNVSNNQKQLIISAKRHAFFSFMYNTGIPGFYHSAFQKIIFVSSF